MFFWCVGFFSAKPLYRFQVCQSWEQAWQKRGPLGNPFFFGVGLFWHRTVRGPLCWSRLRKPPYIYKGLERKHSFNEVFEKILKSFREAFLHRTSGWWLLRLKVSLTFMELECWGGKPSCWMYLGPLHMIFVYFCGIASSLIVVELHWETGKKHVWYSVECQVNEDFRVWIFHHEFTLFLPGLHL